jgi:hypothetical protein
MSAIMAQTHMSDVRAQTHEWYHDTNSN